MSDDDSVVQYICFFPLNKKYKCETCGEKILEKSRYEMHLQSHKQVQPISIISVQFAVRNSPPRELNPKKFLKCQIVFQCTLAQKKHIDDKHSIDVMIYNALFVIDPLSWFVMFDHVHIV